MFPDYDCPDYECDPVDYVWEACAKIVFCTCYDDDGVATNYWFDIQDIEGCSC